MTLLERRLDWQRSAKEPRPGRLRVATLSTFTADPLAPYLGTALEALGFFAEVRTGPYNQIVQECLSDQSQTARFQPEVLVCWARLEDLWGALPWPLDEPLERHAAAALEVAEHALDAARRWRSTLIFVLPLTPGERPLGAGDTGNPSGVAATAAGVREALRSRLARQKAALLCDAEDSLIAVGGTRAFNPRLLALAHIPYAEELFAHLGDRLARVIALGRRPARKVVAVDADGTLWGGVVGEDGPAAVDLAPNGPGAAHRAFQAHLLELRRSGVLLALVSKNDPAVVWEAFERPEMVLERDHFAAVRIGWRPKSEYLAEIAGELGLGLDSFVLIDDSPAELAEVAAAAPEVACIQIPADVTGWPDALERSAALDRLPPTSEDLARPALYAEEHRRQGARSAAASPEAFLDSLAVRVAIAPPRDGELSRLTQLVNKTNQLNLNCRRRSQPELSAVSTDPRYAVRLIRADDRFGDYGIVGAYILERSPSGAVVLDTFLLSCRALGRGVEEAMLSSALGEAGRLGAGALLARVEAHPRNEPAREFFARFGAEPSGALAPLGRCDWPRHVARAT